MANIGHAVSLGRKIAEERAKEVEYYYLKQIQSRGSSAYGDGDTLKKKQRYLAMRLMRMNIEESSAFEVTADGCEVTLHYILKWDSDKGAYYIAFSGFGPKGAPQEIMNIGKAKMSRLDSLILKSIHEWATENGMVVMVNSYLKRGD